MRLVSSLRALRTGLLLLASICAFTAKPAGAEQFYLNGQPANVSVDYAATARIGVDTPTTLDPQTLEFTGFDGVADYFFDVTGTIRIWQAGPVANFNDQITGALVQPGAGGNSVMRLEIVSLTGVNVVGSNGAVINSVVLGDGIDVPGGVKDNNFFSTGGATEPGGVVNNGFMNLFLEVDVQSPGIPVPAALQGLLGLTLPIGPLHNYNTSIADNNPLHLQNLNDPIDEFPPSGIPFLQTAPFVSFFAPTTHPLVVALNQFAGRPLTEMAFVRFVSSDLRISAQAVPEPASMVLAGLSLCAFGTVVYRRRKLKIA